MDNRPTGIGTQHRSYTQRVSRLCAGRVSWRPLSAGGIAERINPVPWTDDGGHKR